MPSALTDAAYPRQRPVTVLPAGAPEARASEAPRNCRVLTQSDHVFGLRLGLLRVHGIAKERLCALVVAQQDRGPPPQHRDVRQQLAASHSLHTAG